MSDELPRFVEQMVDNPQNLKVTRIQVHKFIKFLCSVLSTFRSAQQEIED